MNARATLAHIFWLPFMYVFVVAAQATVELLVSIPKLYIDACVYTVYIHIHIDAHGMYIWYMYGSLRFSILRIRSLARNI